MKQSSIRTKFFLLTAVVIAVVVAAVTWVALAWQNQELEETFTDNVRTIATVSKVMLHSSAEEYAKSRGYTYHRIASGSHDANAQSDSVAQEASREFKANSALEVYSKQITDNGVPVLVVFAPGRYRDECVGCHTAVGVDTFKDRKTGELVAVFGISAPMEKLVAQRTSSFLYALVVGIMLIGIVLLSINNFMNRIVIRPLKEFVLQSERVAEGDLGYLDTPELSKRMNSGDEIGQMARAFGKMIGGLRELIGQVREASSAVASSSSEISASAEQMAAGAVEQTSQAGEVAAAVEQMTKTIVENSKNASTTAQTAKKAKDAAGRGGVVVDETIGGMKHIAEVVQKSSSTVEALGKSSDQIGEIVGVIEDIADQTNLLALNAAIEAARAGDQGRGFAVVADEVRKLAERTTKATKEIATMIKTIQLDTSGAVASMLEGRREVDAGIRLADKAGGALKEIVTISQSLTDMVTQIAAAGEQQSKASEQISRNVESISAVTGQTASGTQQIARASEDLNRLTEQLQDLVVRFKLPDGTKAGQSRSVARSLNGDDRIRETNQELVLET
jgi:methyl-accepting chemotaxis protein